MKLSTLFEESPGRLRDELVKALRGLGYELLEKEASPGAFKAWFKPAEKPLKLEEIADKLKDRFKDQAIRFHPAPARTMEDKVLGKSFELTPGDVQEDEPGLLFLAVYSRSRAGDDYKHGKDT